MEVHSEGADSATPGLSCSNVSYWTTEDSGYTSFTPGSVDCPKLSGDTSGTTERICFSSQIQVSCDITPDTNLRLTHTICSSVNILSNRSNEDSAPVRRGIKRQRPVSDDEVIYSVPTPVSKIAGGIQKLKVIDTNLPCHMSFSIKPATPDSSQDVSGLYHHNDSTHILPYPTTPVKKICRTSCKLSPMRKSSKKLNFTIHSLSCDSHGLQHRPQPKVRRTILFRPDQKVDIIKTLNDAGAWPPIKKIFSYLSNEDIYNFSLVSRLWCHVWSKESKTRKQEFETFMETAQENKENSKEKNKAVKTPKKREGIQIRPWKEVQNVLNNQVVKSSPRSPPGTPRTNRFKKFTKSASMDTRLQIWCVRCSQPSKVTEEASGEEWAECTSMSCSYQFCKFCKCDRHPGKRCFQYDLEGPSPSKRKKSTCAVGTKKSRRNLRRLL